MNEIKCTNDTLFKYLLIKSDQLRRIIIQYTAKIVYNKITILNPNLLPDHAYEKNIYLDMALVDDNGNHINIEMQAGRMIPGANERFQYYPARDVSDQLEQGDDYTKLAPCFQIVFIQDKRGTDKLVEHYTLRSEDRELEGNLFNIIFVHLPNIMLKVKTKGLEQLNIFERIIYAFQTDLNHDIIALRDEVILEMYEYKRKYNIEEEQARLWERAKKFQQYLEKRLEKEAEEAKKQLITTKEALDTAKEELDTAKEKLDSTKEQLNSATKNLRISIENIMTKFNCSYDEAIDILGLRKSDISL